MGAVGGPGQSGLFLGSKVTPLFRLRLLCPPCTDFAYHGTLGRDWRIPNLTKLLPRCTVSTLNPKAGPF